MVSVVEYNPSLKNDWDKFVKESKNGVFFFLRDYVEYHSYRFTDCSLMFYDDKNLQAVLPANLDGDVLSSHGGLSFGGMVLDHTITTVPAGEIFDALWQYARDKKVYRIIYKCLPHIYHIHPAEEDLYWLYRADASLVRRNPSAVINMKNKMSFQTLRVRGVKRAIKNRLVIDETRDYKSFWEIASKNLMDRHKTKPTHSLKEIEYLRNKFPENIKLFASFKDGQMVAGVVMYENRTLVRAQYISTTPEGGKMGALDVIFNYLINTHYANIDYFDFGVSTETFLVDDKLILNEGLIFQKEGFGSRSVMYDTYEIEV